MVGLRRRFMDTNKFKDVIIFAFAEPGAIGAGGIIKFFTDKGETFGLNYLSEETPYGEIKEAFPVLKDCRFNGPMAARPANAPQEIVIYTDADNMNINTRVAEGWRHIYTGVGNHLVIKAEIFDEFSEAISDLTEEVDIYCEWLNRARKLYGSSGKG